jgi:hypothetical protein
MDEARAGRFAALIVILQRITGIIAYTIPFTMPFVCTGTFLVAEVLNFRKRRSAKIAVTSTAAENATS